MRMNKRALVAVIALVLGLSILWVSGSAREEVDTFYMEIEVEEIIKIEGMAIVDVTVHSTNVPGATFFSAEQQEEVPVGKRLSFATIKETFTLYLRDADAAEIISIALPLGTYKESVVFEDSLLDPSPVKPEAPAEADESVEPGDPHAPGGTDIPGAKRVDFFIGKTTYNIDGRTESMDVAPFIEGGRTFIPVRFIAEALGADVDYTVDGKGYVDTVTLTRKDRVVDLAIGEFFLEVRDGKTDEVASVEMDVAAFIRDGRTFLPFRFIAEAFQADVDYSTAPDSGLVEQVWFVQP